MALENFKDSLQNFKNDLGNFKGQLNNFGTMLGNFKDKTLDIFSFVYPIAKWLIVGIVTLFLIILGTSVYPLFQTCWVCDVFKSIYDAFSIVSFEIYSLFKEPVVIVISVCFALWLVHQVYTLLKPSVSSVLIPDEGAKFSAEFLKTIYKKIFLVVVVLGLVIFNEPKNVFSNSFELILDFGTSIGRTILRNKIDKNKLPDYCKDDTKKQEYDKKNALSMSTRDNLSCLIEETILMRRQYVDFGLTMVSYGLVPIVLEVVKYVTARLAFYFGGKALVKFGTEKFLKTVLKNNKNLEKKLEKAIKSGDKKREEQIKEQIKKQQDKVKAYIKNGGGDVLLDNLTKKQEELTKKLAEAGNDKIKKKLEKQIDEGKKYIESITIAGGDIWIDGLNKTKKELEKLLNDTKDTTRKKDIQSKLDEAVKKMETARKYVSEDLFKKGEKGVEEVVTTADKFMKNKSLINKTGNFLIDHNKLPANAVAIAGILTNKDVQIGIAGLGMVLGFFIINLYFPLIIIEFILFLGIVFILFPVLAACYIFEVTRNFATVSFNKTMEFSFKLIFMCVAMVVCASLNDFILGGGIVQNTQDLTDILNNITSDNFTKEMLADWYFIRVFIALFFNAVVMNQMGSLAGWFGTNTKDSGLVSGIESLKKSFVTTAMGVGRDVKGYVKGKIIKKEDKKDETKEQNETEEKDEDEE